jgi:DNA-binding transcriptional MerR regulator
VGIVKNIEIAENLVSLSQGRAPVSLGLRMLPALFFRKKGLTKAQIKKLMMRRRRMFVDNIVMHHKRLHDQNRKKVIEKTRTKLSSKTSKTKSSPGKSDLKPRLQKPKAHTPNKNPGPKQTTPEKGHIKGAIDIGRQRSKSKWAVRVKDDGTSKTI